MNTITAFGLGLTTVSAMYVVKGAVTRDLDKVIFNTILGALGLVIIAVGITHASD